MVHEIKDTPERIRNFIVDNFLYGQQSDLKDTDSFLEGGILDSTGVLQLIAFLTAAFGITVEDEEVTPDNLDSIEKISAYLHRKLNSGDSL